jgi:hypothetical protein
MKSKKILIINKDGSSYYKKLKFLGNIVKLDIDSNTH